jgi:hypothetical protein
LAQVASALDGDYGHAARLTTIHDAPRRFAGRPAAA